MSAKTKELRGEMLCDLFTTALEGGIGYWSSASAYHWSNDDGTPDLDGFYAEIEDDEADGKEHRIDRAVIERGLALIVTGKVKVNATTLGNLTLLSRLDDEADYDADDADAVVQAGLFGELVYGVMALPERPKTLADWLVTYDPFDRDGCHEGDPFLLVETSTYDQTVFLTTHQSMLDAAVYHDSQEYAEDWVVIKLVGVACARRCNPPTPMAATTASATRNAE